jgi:hypothetical protein
LAGALTLAYGRQPGWQGRPRAEPRAAFAPGQTARVQGSRRNALTSLTPSRACSLSAPGRTRTCGPKFRKLVLYPPELRARHHVSRCICGCYFLSRIRSILSDSAYRVQRQRFSMERVGIYRNDFSGCTLSLVNTCPNSRAPSNTVQLSGALSFTSACRGSHVLLQSAQPHSGAMGSASEFSRTVTSRHTCMSPRATES